MRDPYEVLGVDKSATQEAIKAAYQEQAQVCHPDKAGGSHEAFVNLNKAYNLLKDPVRRAQYDETGSDKPRSMETEVHAHLARLFTEALAQEIDIPIVRTVTNSVEATRKRFANAKKEHRAKRAKLVTKRGKIKRTSSGLNLIHALINDQLKNIELSLKEIDHQDKIAEACLIELENYTEDRQVPTYTVQWNPASTPPFPSPASSGSGIYFQKAGSNE